MATAATITKINVNTFVIALNANNSVEISDYHRASEWKKRKRMKLENASCILFLDVFDKRSYCELSGVNGEHK